MENKINVSNFNNNIDNNLKYNSGENHTEFNSQIFHYKEFLLNLEKEFADKLMKFQIILKSSIHLKLKMESIILLIIHLKLNQ